MGKRSKRLWAIRLNKCKRYNKWQANKAKRCNCNCWQGLLPYKMQITQTPTTYDGYPLQQSIWTQEDVEKFSIPNLLGKKAA